MMNLLTHRLDFLIETLDTLHQLRRQSAQLLRVYLADLRKAYSPCAYRSLPCRPA
ncbi:hypothetical protein [Pseudomonas syringae]|uniref:hypothetical protein n=1 Tax=Pseudomonas syringae TaxID=317 RepID=UPI0020BD71E8|nr:hypothetical protein [Pseudomonas syringae]